MYKYRRGICMNNRIKYPNDTYKYVTEITIKVSPARFNPDQFIEKMILKKDSVSYIKTYKDDKKHYNTSRAH